MAAAVGMMGEEEVILGLPAPDGAWQYGLQLFMMTVPFLAAGLHRLEWVFMSMGASCSARKCLVKCLWG